MVWLQFAKLRTHKGVNAIASFLKGRKIVGILGGKSDMTSMAHFLQNVLAAREITQEHQRTKVMNTLEMKGNWNIAKGKLKQKFAQLTDDDLQFVEGKEDELIGRIQKRTGHARADIQRVVDGYRSSGKH
jgi:uncharacterized protein YjbJ (UPF0337 family)